MSTDRFWQFVGGAAASVLGKYQLMRCIAEGGSGAVWEAQDSELGRRVALKLLRKSGNKVLVERMRREATALARLQHPNIVTVYDAGSIDGLPFIAMELAVGETLAAQFARNQPPLRRRIQLLIQVADALQHAHEIGIVHRDLKPANIIVDERGNARLVDFGLAQLAREATLTQAGSVLGTPLYMAPEQVAGDTGAVGAAADIWALGVILYEALAGKPPFIADRSESIYRMIAMDDPVPPRCLRPGIPHDLEILCLKALAKESAARFESAGAMAAELRRWLAGESIESRPAGLVARVRRMLRRHRMGTVAVLTALATAGIALGVLLPRWSEERRARAEAEAQRELGLLWSQLVLAKQGYHRLASDPRLVRRELTGVMVAIERFVQRRPHDGLGYYVRARGHFYLGEIEEAESALATALREQPDLAPAMALLCQLKLERFQMAILLEAGARVAGVTTPELLRGAIDLLKRMETSCQYWGLPRTREDASAETLLQALKACFVEGRPAEAIGMLKEALRGENGGEDHCLWLGHLCVEASEREAWYSRTLEYAPHSARARYHRGIVRGRAGRLVEAIADYDVALVTNPRMIGAYVNRADSHMRRGDPESAAADCEAILVIDPRCADAYNTRGALRHERGHAALALDDFNRAIALDAGYVQPYYNRGLARAALGDFDGAIEDYDRAIALKMDTAKVFNNRGVARKSKGDVQAAITDFNTALARDPRFAAAWVNRGLCWQSLQDLKQAFSDFDRAIDLDGRNAVMFINRGSARQGAGETLAAIEDLTRAIELDSRQGRAWTLRGVAQAELGRNAEAIHDFSRALDLDSNDAGALANRGKAKALAGDLAGAIADLDRAIELNGMLAFALLGRGVVRHKLRELDGAERDLTRAIELQQRNAEAWLKRASVRGDKGRMGEAIEDCTRALEIDSRLAEAWLRRGTALHDTGDVAGAIRDLRRFLELAPADPRCDAVRRVLQGMREPIDK